MESKQFAAAYPRLHELPPEEDGSNFATSQRWSALFGSQLHSILIGERPETLNVDTYLKWLDTDYAAMEERLFAKRGEPETIHRAAAKISELSYHVLNGSLMPLWMTEHIPADTNKNKQTRKNAIITAQGGLAIRALGLYDYRNSLIQKGTYYDPNFMQMRNAIQGRLTEMDAAITVLNHIRRDHLDYNFFAAPAQFEHGVQGENNTDFILIDPQEDQTVGLQVKTSVSDRDIKHYDNEKIILIDGVVDLGNQRLVENNQSRRPKVETWGGMIAVSHLLETPRTDLEVIANSLKCAKTFLIQQQFLAKRFVGGTKSYTKTATDNVGERIEHYFEMQKAA